MSNFFDDEDVVDTKPATASNFFDDEDVVDDSIPKTAPEFGKDINEDIGRISAKYKVDPETLKSRQIGMGYYPEEERQKNLSEGKHFKHLGTAASATVNSIVGEGLLGGLPSYITKKMGDDNEEAAMDELRRAVDHHKKGPDVAIETLLSMAPAAMATKAIKGIGMADKATKAAQAGASIAESARAGVMESDSGRELKGAGLGGGIAAAVEAIPYVGKALGKAGKVVGKTLTGVDDTAVDYYLKNADDVNKSTGLTEVTDKFLKNVDELSGELSQDSAVAFKMLRDSGKKISTEAFSSPLRDEAAQLVQAGSFTPDRARAVALLETIAKNIDSSGAKTNGRIGLEKGKALLQQLDNEYTKMADKKLADSGVIAAIGRARKTIDEILKKSVPEYATHMAKLADDTKVVSNVADKFRQPSGAQNLLKRVQNGKDEFSRRAIEKLDERGGTNFLKELQDGRVSDAFTKESTQGSRKTLLGSLIGNSAAGSAVGGIGSGSWEGALAGGLAGAGLDKFGGVVYKKILDGGMKFGKYAAPLKKIFEQRGPASVAIAHQTLMKRDPEYKKLFEDKEDERESAVDDFIKQSRGGK